MNELKRKVMLEEIKEYPFKHCEQLQSITVDINNQVYSSDSTGALLNKRQTVLYQYPIGNAATTYTLPNSVETIKS